MFVKLGRVKGIFIKLGRVFFHSCEGVLVVTRRVGLLLW